MTDGFRLNIQLAADTHPVGEMKLSRLLLMNDANFPWLILVPRRADVSEIMDLSIEDRLELMEEICAVGACLKDLTGALKINVGALGNMVRQLHVHVIARFAGDPAWPGPVWGKAPPRHWEPEAAGEFARLIAAHLGLES